MTTDMATHAATLPHYLPTAPPQPSSGGSETSSEVEPIFPSQRHPTFTGPHMQLQHQGQALLPQLAIPYYQPVPPPPMFSPVSATSQQALPSPINGMPPLPWVDVNSMMPIGLHGDPFRTYAPAEGRAGPTPSALGFMTGQMAPGPPPPPFTVPRAMDAYPYPQLAQPMHLLPHNLAPPPPPQQQQQQLGRPRPHPYITHNVLYINDAAPETTEREVAEVLQHHGIEATSISVTSPVPMINRGLPDDYYNWMPKQGTLVFRGNFDAEKALATIGNNGYLTNQRRVAISPFTDPRICIGPTNVTPRIVRPVNPNADGRAIPRTGEVWDAARPWGSIKSVQIHMEQVGTAEPPSSPSRPLAWKATIDFWYAEEADAFEYDTNAAGQFLGWQVSVLKDQSFIPLGMAWPPVPWDMPPASWQSPIDQQPMPWRAPSLPIEAMTPAPGPPLGPVMPPSLTLPPQTDSVATHAFPPEQNGSSPNDQLVAPVLPPVAQPTGDSSPAVQVVIPPVPAEAQVAADPAHSCVAEQTLAPSGAPPPTPPSPAVKHPLPPRPESSTISTDEKSGALQEIQQPFHHQRNSWRGKNAGRPPVNIFGPPQHEQAMHHGRLPPAPWASHYKFAGGVPMPVSPPWETVPLRGGRRNSNAGGFKYNNKGFRRSWRQVDGGYVADDGSVVQHAPNGPRPHRHKYQAAPDQSGVCDPCNLIIRGLDPDISGEYLREVFKVFGTVHNTRLMRDTEGRSKGYGFVSFTSPEDTARAKDVMNNSQMGSRIIRVDYHRPQPTQHAQYAQHQHPRPFRHSNWKTTPQRMPQPLPPKEREAVIETAASDTTVAHSETEATNKDSDTEATSTEEVTTFLNNVNLDDLTLESLSGMPPAQVLAIVKSDVDVLARLDISTCDGKSLPQFTGTERAHVIRYINKAAPAKYHGKKKSDIVNAIRTYVNGLSEDNERAFGKLLPYHKLVLAMALKD